MSGYVPKLIQQTINRKSGDIVTSIDWNTILNLLINQGDDTAINLESLYNIISQSYSSTTNIQEMINNKIIEIGAGDMAKSIYDSNNDGIIDKAASIIDNSITTNNLKNSIVTETKLATAVQTKLNKIHSAMFKIDYNNATSYIIGSTNSDTTVNNTYFFDLGFTPKAVLIFTNKYYGIDTGSNYAREKKYHYLCFGYNEWYEYSSYDRDSAEDYGGFATTGNPAIGVATKLEIFSITTNGINIKKYNYSHENNSGDKRINIIDLSNSYCIAIG